MSASSHDFRVVADTFSGQSTVTGNVLRDDVGATAVVRSTSPSDGTVTVNADGAFTTARGSLSELPVICEDHRHG